MPTYAIVYIAVPGPVMVRPHRVPFRSQNIQVECYGPDLRTAGLLYSTWYSEFYPVDITKAQGFIAAHCAVSSLEEVGSPQGLYSGPSRDIGENIWPRFVSTHLIKFSEVYIP